MSDHEGTSTINLGLASSLVSRFDLVLILRDERNDEWDTRVANHIFYETGPTLHEDLYDLTKLKAHFAAVRDFDPIVADGCKRILKAYYLGCRADEERDPGRTTLRFNDSLYRLAKAHAKLLFRPEVTEIDAAVAVMLMESSFGFGRVLQSKNVLRKDLPLGPSNEEIYELIDRLNIESIDATNGQVNMQHDNSRFNTRTVTSEGRPVDSTNMPLGAEDRINENESSNPPNEPKTQNSNNENVRRFDAKANAVQKRKRNRSFSNENVSPQKDATVHNSRQFISQPVNNLLRQSVLRLQNFEMIPLTSTRKRFRPDLDEDELDKLFTLDNPIPESREENVGDVVVSNRNVTVSENPSTSTASLEQNVRAEQPNRFRIFNNCTDEDLAALDDLDF